VAAKVVIRAVRTPADPALGGAYRLLKHAFHGAEMVSRRDWEAVIRERAAGVWTDLNWHLLVAVRAGRLAGVATGSYLGNVNVGLIGYIAVAPGARKLGIGPRLRRRLRAAFERDALRLARRPLKAIVGEVRSDNPWLATLLTREGVITLDFPYYQPALRKRRPVPLTLYYQALGRPRRSLPTAEVRRLLYTIWRRPYRIQQPLAYPSFRRMLSALAGRRRVGRTARRGRGRVDQAI